MKKQLLAIVAITAICATTASAAVIVGWDNDDAVHYSDNWASTYNDTALNGSTITHGAGIATGYTGGPGATAAMKYTGLASTDMASAVTDNAYLAFTVAASGSDTFDISSIQIADVNMNAASTLMMELRSSVDGFASTLSSNDTTSDAAEGIEEFLTAGITGQTSVDFRIYTYWTVNGGTGTGIHILDDKTTITDFPDAAGLMSDPMVLVNGTVIPEPATLGMVALFGGGLLFIRRRLML